MCSTIFSLFQYVYIKHLRPCSNVWHWRRYRIKKKYNSAIQWDKVSYISQMDTLCRRKRFNVMQWELRSQELKIRKICMKMLYWSLSRISLGNEGRRRGRHALRTSGTKIYQEIITGSWRSYIFFIVVLPKIITLCTNAAILVL